MAEQDAEDTTPATPDEPDAGLGGRLPLLDPQDLTRARRGVFDRLVASRVPEAARAGFTAQLTDGRFVGPFNSFLYSPQIAGGLLDWADAQVNHSALAADVRQAIILTVGAEWEAEFELYAHTAGARKAGITDTAIDAIKAGERPNGLTPEADLAHRFTYALVRSHTVNDTLYAEALAAFDAPGIVAIVNLIGQYMTISALLNCFQVPVPTFQNSHP